MKPTLRSKLLNYGKKKQGEVREEVFHGAPNFVLDVFYREDERPASDHAKSNGNGE